jgi:AsmA protein
MKGPVKVLAWVVGVLVLLVIVVVVGAKLYLTKDRVLALVVPPMEKALHRKVVIADAGGGLTGLSLEGLDVRAEGAPEPLVSADLIRVRWDLWALLTGTVKVDEVRLVAPHIRVVRKADGTLDIADLLQPNAGAGAPESAAKPEPAAGGASPVAVVVALFSLEKGRVTFEDQTQKPPRVYTLDAIDSRISDFALDRPVHYQLSARLPLAEAGRFSAEGTLNPSTRDVAAAVRIADFDLPALNPVLGGGPSFASGTFGLDLAVEVAGGEKVTARGKAAAQGVTLAAAEQKGQQGDLSLELDASADLPAGTARVAKLDLSAAGQEIHVQADVKGLKTRPRVDFRMDSPELRVDPITALLPPGKGAAPPAPGESTSASSAGPPAAIPVDAFGDVRVGKLLAGGAVVEEVQAHISLDHGVLQVEPAGAKVYGGSLQLHSRADLQKNGPPFDAAVDLTGTQLAQLLAGLSPSLKDTMTGVLGLSTQAQGLGGDLAALKSKTQAEAKDGKILNHPLLKKFAELFRAKEYETLNFYSLKADVETDKGVGQVKSVVFSGPNLQATATGTVGLIDRAVDLRLAVALPREIAARVVPEPQILDGVTDAQGWSRLPLRLSGTLDAPSYGLDAEGLKAAAMKALGGKAQKALEEKVLKNLPGGGGGGGAVEQGLKKLFGQ